MKLHLDSEANSFSCSEDLCAPQDLVPLPSVHTSLREGLLDLTLTASVG